MSLASGARKNRIEDCGPRLQRAGSGRVCLYRIPLHAVLRSVSTEDFDLLTEQEVAKSWRKLFSSPQVNTDTFTKAEALIDELRPESPLRHRLGNELVELRQMRAPAK